MLLTAGRRYAPIQKFAPQDCVASIYGIVDKIDQVFDSGNRQAVMEMKTVFGLGGIGGCGLCADDCVSKYLISQ